MRLDARDAWLSAVVAAFWLGQATLRPYVGPYLTSIDMDATTAALLVSVPSGMGLVLALPVAGLLKGLGTSRLTFFGAAAMAASAFLLAASTNPGMIVLAQLLYGGGVVGFWLPAQSIITEGKTEGEGETLRTVRGPQATRIAGFTFITAVCQLIGPILGGGLASRYSYRAIFLVCGSAFIVALLLSRKVEEVRIGHPVVAPPKRANFRRPRQIFGGDKLGPSVRSVWPVVSLAGVFVFMSELKSTILPIILVADGISPSAIGVLLGLAGLTGISSRALLPVLVAKLGPALTGVVCSIPSAISLVLVVLVGPLWLQAICMAVLGLALGLHQPLTLYLVAHSSDEEGRSVGLALRLMGHRLGQWTAPVVFAGFAQLVATRMAFAGAALLTLAPGIALARTAASRIGRDLQGVVRQS